MEGHTALHVAAEIIKRTLTSYDLDADSIFSEIGIPVYKGNPDQRVSLNYGDKLIEYLDEHQLAPGWRLKMIDFIHPGNIGALGHAWLASSTLMTGMVRLSRYWKIIGTRGRTVARKMDCGFVFSYDPNVESVVNATSRAELTFSFVLGLCRINVGGHVAPLRIEIVGAPSCPMDSYKKAFGCEVVFGCDENRIIFKDEDVNRLLSSANRPLVVVLDSILQNYWNSITKDDVTSKCKRAIVTEIPHGPPGIDVIASKLNMTSRTMQRRLLDKGVVFSELVDRTRRELAMLYIINEKKSVTEIAFMLGFSAPSVFSRAFLRWTGRSPSDYRTKILKMN